MATPPLTDDAFPNIPAGVIPIGSEVLQGSGPLTLNVVNQAPVSGDKYLYVYGRARFKDGFGRQRHVNFCHRYPLAMKVAEPTGAGFSIPLQFARYHQHGNKAD